MVGFHLCNILEMAKLQTENRVVASWFLEVRDEAVRVEGGRSGAGGAGALATEEQRAGTVLHSNCGGGHKIFVTKFRSTNHARTDTRTHSP